MLCVGPSLLYITFIINFSSPINQATFVMFHLVFISYWIFFIEMILYSWWHTFVDAIRLVSSRGSQAPTNGSRGCFLNEKLSKQILLQLVELSSFSLWPLNFCSTTILLTATASVRIGSEDFSRGEASGSTQISCFCCYFYILEVMSNVRVSAEGELKRTSLP